MIALPYLVLIPDPGRYNPATVENGQMTPNPTMSFYFKRLLDNLRASKNTETEKTE